MGTFYAPFGYHWSTKIRSLLSLKEQAWEDIQFPVSSGKVPQSNFPSYSSFTTNTNQYKFGIGDFIDLEAEEIAHWWKEGTLVYPHIHIALDATSSAEVAQYAKFTIYFAYAKSGEVFVEVERDMQVQIPVSSASRTHLFLYSAPIDFSELTIGTQIVSRIKRISATPDADYASDIFITQVGIHAEVDGLGSREIGTK